MTGLEAVEVAQQIESLLRLGETGGTLTSRGLSVTYEHGYWVGGVAPQLIIENVPQPVVKGDVFLPIYVWLKRFEEEEFDPSYIGFWLEGNTLYVDVSDLIVDLDEALATAFLREQLAVYDNANQVSIYL